MDNEKANIKVKTNLNTDLTSHPVYLLTVLDEGHFVGANGVCDTDDVKVSNGFWKLH